MIEVNHLSALGNALKDEGNDLVEVRAAIVNTIAVEVCRRLIARGMSYPPIFYSANLDGGQARNRALIEQFADVIRYRF